VTVFDPSKLDLPLLQKPEFAYSRSQVPDKLKETQESLAAGDAFVAITPEYNLAPSPALLNLLNHFGSSTFSFKPSAIVSYSAGQWGGTRAATALRPILSELGCLPVSAMIHIPKAQEVLDERGNVALDKNRWEGYVDRCFAQLEWWAEAAKQHRSTVDPFKASPAFRSSPSQRNAP
jgi:NAD(P)H-dependent FMN reductase